MKALLEKFHSLSEREQRLVLISAVVIVIGAFYWLIWSPLNSAVEQNRKAVSNQKELLAWTTKSANRVIQLRSSGTSQASFRGSLPQAVNQASSRNNISISRMQPQGEILQVWVDEAPFNDVLSWLHALEGMGVVILQADMAEASAPGMIKIRRLQLGKA